MKKPLDAPSAYVTRKEFDDNVSVLQRRCSEAEDCLLELLNFVDSDIVVRNDYDWKAATYEFLGKG